MPILRARVLSRFQTPKWAPRLPRWLAKHPYALFHALNLLLFIPVIAVISRIWINERTGAYWSEWRSRTPARLPLILNTWNEYQLPPFRGLHDPGLLGFLQNHPLVVAMASTDGRTQVVRENDRFRAPGLGAEDRALVQWMKHAIRSREEVWNPSPEANPSYLKEMLIVCRSGAWYVVVRWRIGSREVERYLRQHLDMDSPFRVGLRRVRAEEQPDPVAPAWSLPPNLQAECPKGASQTQITVLNGTNIPYLREWHFVFMPSWADLNRYRTKLLQWRVVAYGLSLLLPAGLSLGAILHQRLRRRERLEMDRMASMTHSLKTPLGVLKLRCDSIRLGQFDRVRTEVELLRISKEVDQLTAFINQTLQGFLRTPHTPERTLVTPDWFKGIAYDLGPIFEMENRTLDLRLDTCPAWVHEPTLKAAVVTLLENALSYGKGNVVLRTRHRGRRLQIQIKDQGEGLDPLQLDEIGKPFTRFRIQEAEGFQKVGVGLGLFHLACTAQRENWGFRILSKPGHGVLAILEVPVARHA